MRAALRRGRGLLLVLSPRAPAGAPRKIYEQSRKFARVPSVMRFHPQRQHRPCCAAPRRAQLHTTPSRAHMLTHRHSLTAAAYSPKASVRAENQNMPLWGECRSLWARPRGPDPHDTSPSPADNAGSAARAHSGRIHRLKLSYSSPVLIEPLLDGGLARDQLLFRAAHLRRAGAHLWREHVLRLRCREVASEPARRGAGWAWG